MPISEMKRQRVLVTSCVLFSEVSLYIVGDGLTLRRKLFFSAASSLCVHNQHEYVVILVICCYPSTFSYVQVWHAIGKYRTPLRKQYLEAILPPFVAVLRRWRPLLAGIHELSTADGVNPLVLEDRALAADALPIEVVL